VGSAALQPPRVLTHHRTEPVFVRILVGTNGSAEADEAVLQGARIAALFGAELDIEAVCDRPGFLGSEAPLGGEAMARAILDSAGALARTEGVQARTFLSGGEPAHALVHTAESKWTDLLCLGPDSGRAELNRRFGTVARDVLRMAKGSVLIARKAPGESEAPCFPSRIVCAVDGSLDALEAVRQAAELATRAGACLDLLLVVEVVRGRRVGWIEAPQEDSFESLVEATDVARLAGVDPARGMRLGTPGPAIVAEAASAGADLVVMGSRGIHGLRRTIEGSVSAHVARHAPCSVLVARPRLD
jgi:nucleotide-binding universal stress UspA family protein